MSGVGSQSSIDHHLDDGYVLPEEAERRNLELLEHVFNSSPTANILVDKDGKILAVNNACEKLLGFPNAELTGQEIELLVPQRLRLKHKQKRDLFSSSPHPQPMEENQELYALHKDGTEIPVEITLAPLQSSVQFVHLVVLNDISSEKHAKDALHEQTNYINLLKEIAIASNEATTIETGLHYALEKICRLMGWDLGHALLINSSGNLVSSQIWYSSNKQNYLEFIHQREQLTSAYEDSVPGEVLATHQPKWDTGIGQRAHIQGYTEAAKAGFNSIFAYPILSRMGVAGILEFFFSETEPPANSLLGVMPSVGTQLGRLIERKHNEEAILAQENLLRTVLDNLPVAVWVADQTGDIFMSNPAGKKIWGEHHFVGLNQYGEFKGWWADSGKMIQSEEWALSRALKTGEATTEELVEIEGFDGKRRTILNSAAPLHNTEGEILGAIAVNQDVTERTRIQSELTEVQQRLRESLENERLRLAQDLHDGPMQELYGAIFQIQDVLQDLPNSDFSSRIDQTRIVVQNVISNLRYIAGELRPPALAPFGLEKAIRSHADLFASNNPGLTLHLDLDEDNQMLPPNTRLSLFRIYQQLLSNIVRHAEATQVWVRWKLSQSQILMEIEDDGLGFQAPEHWIDLARQGHMGLVGAQERSTALNGKLEVISQPNKGSRIRVILPPTVYDRSSSASII